MAHGTLPTYPFNTPPGLDHDPIGLRLLARAPVVRARMVDGPETWLALGYAEVRQVLDDPRFSRELTRYANMPVTNQAGANPHLMIGMDPPRHTTVRRLMAAAFTPRAVERLRPRMQEIMDDLLDAMAGRDRPLDLVPALAEPFPVTVICELLGVPDADRDQIRELSGILMAGAGYPPAEIMAAVAGIDGYLDKLIAQRRTEPDDALISALIGANDEAGLLSPAELVGNVQLLLVAGHETTANQIGLSLVTLFEHPDQMELLRERPELWPQAVDELLRHCGQTPAAMPRVATKDVELGGELIEEGQAIIPVIGVANRDPSAFRKPARFDILRAEPAAHVAFGHGPHLCLGAHLAKLELQVALSALLDRFPALALAVDPEDLVWKTGLAVRAVQALPVTW